jgi:hypothetical protein
LIVEPNDGPELPYDSEETLMFHEADGQYLDSTGWALNETMPADPTELPDNPMDAADSAQRQARTNTRSPAKP